MLIQEQKLYDLKSAYNQILNEGKGIFTKKVEIENKVKEFIDKSVTVVYQKNISIRIYITGILKKGTLTDLKIEIVKKEEDAACHFNITEITQIQIINERTTIFIK